MEGLIFLLLIIVIIVFVLPIVAIVKAGSAQRSVEDFKIRLRDIEAQLQGLRRARRETGPEQPVETQPGPSVTWAAPVPAVVPPIPAVPPVAQPPPLPTETRPLEAAKAAEAARTISSPSFEVKPKAASSAPSGTAINWEQFMGAKLFAWIGGFALFLGVAFFVKYSFEHNLIPPEVRVAIGFAVGIALVLGGVALKRKENAVTAQTLCATGILILYAVTFACRSFYHFSFFGLIPTFILMTLITA